MYFNYLYFNYFTTLQIARGCIVQALPHKHRRLVDDSLAHWKPVQANKNRRDVVVAMSPGDHRAAAFRTDWSR